VQVQVQVQVLVLAGAARVPHTDCVRWMCVGEKNTTSTAQSIESSTRIFNRVALKSRSEVTHSTNSSR